MRDDFSAKTGRTLAARVAHHCSNPECIRSTMGPALTEDKTINIGVAAHITAAAVLGPRYDATLTPEQRKSASNGIWLCQTCSNLIDKDEVRYTVPILQKWKREAEQHAFTAIASGRRYGAVVPSRDLDEDDLKFLRDLRLGADDTVEAVERRMRAQQRRRSPRSSPCANGPPTRLRSISRCKHRSRRCR